MLRFPPLVELFPHTAIKFINPETPHKISPPPDPVCSPVTPPAPLFPKPAVTAPNLPHGKAKYSFRTPFDASPELLSSGEKEREQKG